VSKQQTPAQWLADASDDDYAAATHFLSLLDSPDHVDKAVAKLRAAHVTEFKATDLLRAAQLLVPEADDRPTREQIEKIKNGKAISPVLLVRVEALRKVIIADGFHRVCAAYRLDPDVSVHCKLAGS
jgi:ribosomal 50S subunit-associated protein YjgA (DUF615 family)